MLGFLKPKVQPEEFGHQTLFWVREFVEEDCGRSLISRWPDCFSVAEDSAGFLRVKGITVADYALYLRTFFHCVLHTAFLQYPVHHRLPMTRGAMEAFTKPVDGYHFATTYGNLQRAFTDEYLWPPAIAALNNPAIPLRHLPYPNAGVASAKFLLHTVIVPHMPDAHLFFDAFRAFSTTVAASSSTVTRAIMQLETRCKIAA